MTPSYLFQPSDISVRTSLSFRKYLSTFISKTIDMKSIMYNFFFFFADWRNRLDSAFVERTHALPNFAYKNIWFKTCANSTQQH